MATSVTLKAGNSPYNVSSGETDTGDLVINGGSMLVPWGGVANTTTIDAGGVLTIDSGGIDSSTILSGGVEVVSVSGSDLDTQISGGEQGVYGSASNATVFAGGIEVVESGGIAGSTTVSKGGIETVLSGGVGNGTTLDGGTEIVASGGTVSGTVTFSGGGELVPDQSTSFTSGALLAGFTTPSNVLDLADISFADHPMIEWSQTNSTSGTLTITDGTHIANIMLLGQYTTASFNSAPDPNGGTDISDPPSNNEVNLLANLGFETGDPRDAKRP